MPVSFEWSSSEDNIQQRDLSWPLLVSNLHPLVDKRMLHEVFEPFGPSCSLQVFRSRNNFCRGYALVTFEHHNDAKNALETLDFSEVLDKLPMRVSWVDHLSFMILGRHEELCEAISYFGQFLTCRVHKNNSFSLDDPKESSSHAPRSLIASHLLSCVSEEDLLEVFIPFGPISTVHVCRNELTRVSGGFGFITFKHRRDAESALEALNFSELFGKTVCISCVQDLTIEEQQPSRQ